MINYNGEDYVKFSSAMKGIDEVAKEKDKEIERLNNIIKDLKENVEILTKIEDSEVIKMQLRNMLYRLKGSDKE